MSNVEGVVYFRAIVYKTLLKSLAGDGQLAHKERRNAPRPRETHAVLDHASGAV